MKCDYSTWLDEVMPIVPVVLHRLVRVIAIQKQEIDRGIPASRHFVTEFLEPHDCAITRSPHNPLCNPHFGIDKTKSTEVKWINQIENALAIHDFPDGNGGGPLSNSYFDERSFPSSPSANCLTFP